MGQTQVHILYNARSEFAHGNLWGLWMFFVFMGVPMRKVECNQGFVSIDVICLVHKWEGFFWYIPPKLLMCLLYRRILELYCWKTIPLTLCSLDSTDLWHTLSCWSFSISLGKTIGISFLAVLLYILSHFVGLCQPHFLPILIWWMSCCTLEAQAPWQRHGSQIDFKIKVHLHKFTYVSLQMGAFSVEADTLHLLPSFFSLHSWVCIVKGWSCKKPREVYFCL